MTLRIGGFFLFEKSFKGLFCVRFHIFCLYLRYDNRRVYKYLQKGGRAPVGFAGSKISRCRYAFCARPDSRLAGSKAQIAVLGSRGWTYLSAAYFDGTVFERGNSEV